MKKNKFINPLKIRSIYLTLCFMVPGFITMCHDNSHENLNNQISELDKKISKDLTVVDVPQKLKPVQDRYVRTKNSLNNMSDTVENCFNQNDSLIAAAFNNYATRVGCGFQISEFLSSHDIATFQKYIAALDSGDFIMGAARSRILQNRGSLHDLSYFFEMFDFDSINQKLENRLAWNFYRDTTNTTDSTEISVLNFENDSLNNLLMRESNLLNLAWRQNIIRRSVNNDTLDCVDSTMHFDNAQIAPYVNFTIPEFDSVRVQYLHNDSIIRSYQNTMDTMTRAEDSLHEYIQSVRHQRDSLIKKRYEITL